VTDRTGRREDAAPAAISACTENRSCQLARSSPRTRSRLITATASSFRRSDCPESVVAKLQALTTKLIEDNPTLADHHMVGPHVPGSGFEGLKSSPGWLDIATHPDIVDMVEQIVGPDIILWGTGIFHKRRSPVPPRHGTATPAILRSSRWRPRPSGLPSSTA
jgi:hypothetical protein